ncbi:cysteine rich repeat-containing protein, partial [Bradyrhizobium guangdongense]|uniref:cysteine rich repeat-containing protein n=1 Tax=Bradyrhizobium guangdongense TaxID=1325090 RepID=UPI001FD9DE66
MADKAANDAVHRPARNDCNRITFLGASNGGSSARSIGQEVIQMFAILKHGFTRSTLLAAVLFATATPIFAQAPTDAQKSAIRSACRSDFMAHCSSVTPGGVEAYQCLKKNV